MNELWEVFIRVGSVNSYLQYKAHDILTIPIAGENLDKDGHDKRQRHLYKNAGRERKR